MLEQDWIDRPHWADPLPEAAARELALAAQCWNDDSAAERHIQAALAAAPGHLAALLGAYKFFFYKNRLAQSLPLAEQVIELAARQLNISPQWQQVGPTDAAFDQLQSWPGLYLHAVKAWGYVQVRLGNLDQGRAALAHLLTLDPRDRMGCARLIAVIDRGGADEEE